MNVFKSAKQACTTDVAMELGIKGRITGPGRGVFCCPYHEDSTPSMTTYPNKLGKHGGFYCFGCHTHGDAIDLWAKVQGVSNLRAARAICDHFNLEYDDFSMCDTRESTPVNPDAMKILEIARYWHEYRLKWYREQVEITTKRLNETPPDDRFWYLEAQTVAAYKDLLKSMESMTDAELLRSVEEELAATIGGSRFPQLLFAGTCS